MLSAGLTLAPTRAIRVTITDDTLSVDLEDGRTIIAPIGWYPRLAYGTPEERSNFQISGAGYGIHWPDLDEDIGVEGLLLGKKSSESQASFARWLQRRRLGNEAKA
ncbi:MAG: DUF2442 domain-containing protein [Chloroflexi bacterium]|nr:DUF2442 domain-containing protein [Chloroflexota bacterium]